MIFLILFGIYLVMYLVGSFSAYRAGYWEGSHTTLKLLKDLDRNFLLRESDDVNFQKVKKEWHAFVQSVDVKKFPTPSGWDLFKPALKFLRLR